MKVALEMEDKVEGTRPFAKMLYAHRGANLRLPENTLEAFRRGLQDGANAIELDVRRTNDDVIIVFHDEDGERVAGQEALVAESSYEEVQQWNLSLSPSPDPVSRHFTGQAYRVPTLIDVLEAFPNTFVNVDIKAHDLRTVSLVMDVIAKHKTQNRVLLTSSNYRITSMFHSLRYQGQIGLSALELAALYVLPLKFLRRYKWEGRAAQVPLSKFGMPLNSAEFINKCHSLGLRVDFWVVNDQETARELGTLGADGIMSDDPAMVQSAFSPT